MGAFLVIVALLCFAAVELSPETERSSRAKPIVSDLTLHPERAQRESYVLQTEQRIDDLEARIARVEKSLSGMRETLQSDLAAVASSVKIQTERIEKLGSIAANFEPKPKAASEEADGTPAPAVKPDPISEARMGPDPYGTYGASEGSFPSDGRLAMAVIESKPAEERKPVYSRAPLFEPDVPLAANRSGGQNAGEWLPAGSFVSATLLTGLYASTSGTAGGQPVPVLMRVDKPAVLPSKWRSEIQTCHITGAATGDLSSERVQIRLDRLSCISHKGETLDIRVGGYAVGGDGKVGVRGKLVTRSGQAIANALSLSVLSGVGKAVSLSSQQISTSTLTGTQTVDYGNSIKAGLGEGFASGMQRLVDYYIRLADKVLPVLEVPGGIQVDLVFSQGVRLASTN